jgi:starvation-inducible DNA-binding protein
MKTMNSLDSNAKKTSIAILNARLADSIDLALAVKQAHWNIKGPRFIAIHEMLDKLRDDVNVGVDLIAERATALGGTALGTVQTTTSASKLPPYPTDIHDIDDHLKALIERVAMCTCIRAKLGRCLYKLSERASLSGATIRALVP